MSHEPKDLRGPAYLKRKEDQAWEMAGLARQDGDTKDEQRWTAEAQALAARRREIV
jgi:hypothetical protein